MRLILALVISTLAVLPAAAQDWQSRQTDDGVAFLGTVIAPDRTLFIWCGGATPGGPGLPPGGDPIVTDPGTVYLAINHPALRPPAGTELEPSARADIMMVASGQGFGLPEMWWDQVNDTGYMLTLSLSDPLFTAMAQGGEVQVWAGGTPVAAYPGAGLAGSLAAIAGHCGARWQAAAPVDPRTNVLMVDATVDVVAACGSNADYAPGYALTGDIDGDGTPDLVLDWAQVTCLEGPPRPFCGAAYCSASVYLSSRPDQRPFTDFLAAGVALEPGPDGRVRLISGVTAASCPQSTRPARCETVWAWTGTGFQGLPPGGG